MTTVAGGNVRSRRCRVACPIVVDGNVVGAIGVSGAASAQQDDEIAQAAADSFAKRRSANAAPP